ncbi:Retrovirus-related Pol polyprotein from transposon TNT 1-94, partial [Operophtera brumata]
MVDSGVVVPGTGTDMLSLGGGVHVKKLEGVSNYNSWKFQMKMVLTLEGLWSCIGSADSQTDTSRDQKALARICLSVKAACHQHVRHCVKAKEAWDKLANTFEDKGLYRRVLLLRQLHHTDYSQFSSMTDYIDRIMTRVQQLADIGRVIDDAEVAELLLSGLPQEFDALVSNLETACITNTLSSEL